MSQSQQGAGISSTASAPTDQNVQAIVSTTNPGWKYCTLPDKAKKHELKCNFCEKLCKGGITRIKLHLAHIPKCNVAKCERVPADVKAEMIELLAKKNIVKENKTKEWKRARDEVNLDHSEGEASSEEEGGNSVVVVHSGRVGSTSSSKGGPMERFCKSTPEEVVAAKKGASLSNKVHSKRRNRLLHDRMSDLVFVKFNSRLKHKRENKTRDPIEKQVVDILEDDDNEFITGVALAADDEQEEPEDPHAEGEKDQEQDVAPA
ncbi:hypothetical protein E2562_009239 [Oryza meyeriana var. granulata]|uniref:BED-type domain-containing protein n=1 Tax=Oryza meyeriana var. granulata TaxID=110450 RepID=A0A6G1D287_9ORYZ|nr:hypothetical protein E2562_009239 [Oryza meyeriana var. granulata]